MEEGVLEQWVLGWVLLVVLHAERGKWKDGRGRVSLAFATSTGAPRTQALHLAIETMPFRCAGFQFLFTADILGLLIRSGRKRCYNRLVHSCCVIFDLEPLSFSFDLSLVPRSLNLFLV
ncbi:hypothetical protein Tco_0915470 [Tanacetum coccineum]